MVQHAADPPLEKPTLRGMGGGAGGVHRGVDQERHCKSPNHPLMSGGKSRLSKLGTARPLSPPKNTPIVEWGGGDRGCSLWRRPRTALQVAYPPAHRKTHHTFMGGGGTRGVQRDVAQARQCTSPIPPYPTSPIPPYPPPPLMSWKIKIKNETYLFGGNQKRQTTH
jgi:hypothetical protein